MATWSIRPNTASINNNGVATIPKNTGDSAIVYTVTYDDGNGGGGQGTYVVNPCPTPPTTCELIVLNGEGPYTYLPCEGGIYSNWLCNYEVLTTSQGVTSKTAEGSATGEFEVTDNCNGVTRELNIENHASSDLILNSLIDDETGEQLLDTYSNCLLSGTFTQEGGSTPPTPTHITSCNDLKWYDEDGHFTNISDSSYVYDGNKYAGATFSIHPTFNNNWVKCKKCQIVQLETYYKCPEYFPQGVPGCQNPPITWYDYWAVQCDGQYGCSTTGGTSGTSEINSNGTSGWGKIVNVFANEYGGLQPFESSYANLSVSASNNIFSADFTCSWSYGEPMDLRIPECQDITDILQINTIVMFEIYKDQSKTQYTDSDETITCTFDLVVNLLNNQ